MATIDVHQHCNAHDISKPISKITLLQTNHVFSYLSPLNSRTSNISQNGHGADGK